MMDHKRIDVSKIFLLLTVSPAAAATVQKFDFNPLDD